MMKKMFGIAVGAGLALAVSSGAQAASVASQFFYGQNLISDNSAEYLINNAGGATTLDIGDVLKGVFDIGTVEPVGSPLSSRPIGSAGVNELTGTFEAMVVAKAGGPGAWSFVFAPTAAFMGAYGPGAMVALYEDTTPDYNREGTIAAGLASATDGALWMILGMTGSGAEYWVANTFTDDVTVAGAIPLPFNGGTFNVALGILANASGLTFTQVPAFNPLTATVGLVDIAGSGSILGKGGSGTSFDVFDNVDFTANVVPEPTSMLLLGTGLLGAGLVGRRRKKA